MGSGATRLVWLSMRSALMPVLRVLRWVSWFVGYTLAVLAILKPVHDMQC